jgi:hypothetical protein
VHRPLGQQEEDGGPDVAARPAPAAAPRAATAPPAAVAPAAAVTSAPAAAAPPLRPLFAIAPVFVVMVVIFFVAHRAPLTQSPIVRRRRRYIGERGWVNGVGWPEHDLVSAIR